jgi:hypothetical protein
MQSAPAGGFPRRRTVPHRCWTVVILVAAGCSTLIAQPDSSGGSLRTLGVGGGLGVTLIDAADVVDYINLQYQPTSKLQDFTPASEFFGSGEIRISESWGVKLEYSYLLKSYSVPQPFGADYSFSYGVHMPLLMAQYLVSGRGYAFKFGGGAGYHVAKFSEDASVLVSDSFTSKGVGLKIEAEGNTEFDDHLFGLITVDVRDDLMGEFRNSKDAAMMIPVLNKPATMDFFSLGVKFGLIYYL